MAENTPAKVVMVDRSTYDRMAKENTTIYFVREGSPELNKMMSLYVGTSKQCDLYDITGETEVTEDNPYKIPDAYKIPNKLLFYHQTITTDTPDPNNSGNETTYDFYRISMWNPTLQKFLDCTGFPNNVIVLTQGVLPTTADAIKDFVYVDVMNRNIWVFDGNSYVPIIELSQYATKVWVEEYVDAHSSAVNVDGVTILKTPQTEVLHGAGADVTGVIFNQTPPATDVNPNPTPVPYTAEEGAHTFNTYHQISSGTASGSGYNIALYRHSAVFGYDNKELGKSTYDTPANKRTNYTVGSNIIGGVGNTISESYATFVIGRENAVSGAAGSMGTICSGYQNQINFIRSNDGSTNPDYVRSYAFVIGDSNNTYCSSVKNGQSDAIIGSSNRLGYDSSNTTYGFGLIVGTYNTVLNKENFSANAVFGQSCRIYGHIQNTLFIGSGSWYGNLTAANDIEYTNNLFIKSSVLSDATPQSRCGVGNSILVNGKISVPADYQNIFIFGEGCEAVADATTPESNRSLINVYCFGRGLIGDTDSCIYAGTYNDPSYTISGVSPAFVLGNGDGNSSSPSYQQTSMIISKDGSIYSKNGNFTCVNKDVSVVSDINDLDITPSSGAVTLSQLPKNCDQNIISTTDAVSSITIQALTVPINGSSAAISTVADYTSVIVLKKSSSVTSIANLVTNFTPGSANRIYLMNPDLDITTYTMIHLLLFYDGFHVCCIAAGYEEDPVV